ncbi:hypothetical protein Pmani_003934 [Petrolisthes manimaculis]|uniref:Uncharacterized protein n=1 Tax=Petrolisthes manimaculis TaxID=1843537 RepID=A0AAE1QHJ6_9EUCA|nr:hypothetical protein Pmani_003934 [Petrolisthes manimaculis]
MYQWSGAAPPVEPVISITRAELQISSRQRAVNSTALFMRRGATRGNALHQNFKVLSVHDAASPALDSTVIGAPTDSDYHEGIRHHRLRWTSLSK